MPREESQSALDSLFLSRIRLGIMAALVGGDELDFTFLKEALETTDGNLGAHLRRLEEAGMIRSRKRFIARRPNTSYKITAKGGTAFADYVQGLAALLGLAEEREES